jgi:Na+/proline symporter
MSNSNVTQKTTSQTNEGNSGPSSFTRRSTTRSNRCSVMAKMATPITWIALLVCVLLCGAAVQAAAPSQSYKRILLQSLAGRLLPGC